MGNNELNYDSLSEGFLFKQIIESAQDGIIVYGSDLTYKMWNPSMERITGIPSSAVVGRRPAEIFPFLTEAGVVKRLEKALSGSNPKTIDVQYDIPETGKKGWCSDTSSPLKNDKGEIIGVIGIVREISERKKAEETLLASEQKLKKTTDFLYSVVDAIPHPMAVKDSRHRWLLINKVIVDILGKSREEMFGITDHDILRKEEADIFRAVEEEVFRTGKPNVNEEMVTEADGRERWQITTKSLFQTPDGEQLLLAIANDITDRKNLEFELLKKEAHFRLIFENSRDAIGVVNNQGVLIMANGQYARLFGYDSVSEMLGHENINFFHDSVREELLQKMKTRLLGGDVPALYETLGMRKDGTVFALEIKASTYTISGTTNVVALLRDVTEIKRINEELKTSNDRYKTLLDSSPDSICIISLDGIILECSESTAHKVGLSSKKELIGSSIFSFISAPEHEIAKTRMKRTIEQKLLVNREYLFVKTDGTQFPVEISARVICDENGEPTSFISIIKDITERKQMETLQKELADYEKNAIIGKVAGNIAHDFNNILGIITGNSDILLSKNPPPEIEKKIKTIQTCSLRGRELTKNLLQFARDKEPDRSYFDLNQKIKMLIQSLQGDLKDIEVVAHYEQGMSKLCADIGMLENALINMIKNSIHAMSRENKPMLVLRTYTEGKNICIEIEDNGCGIPGDVQHKIYDPTFTLKGKEDRHNAYKPEIKGNGYGMANVKQFILAHGGAIGLDSKLGKGAKFKISLPTTNEQTKTREIEVVHKAAESKGKSILLIEDEPELGEILYSILAQAGCHVDMAENGEDALRMFESNKYDAISLDYLLPDMNGFTIYRRIRERNKDIPVIFVSGNFEFMQSMIDLKKDDSNVDHLPKPFNNIEYANKIHEWLAPESQPASRRQ